MNVLTADVDDRVVCTEQPQVIRAIDHDHGGQVAWDAFAMRSNASFKATHRNLSAWAMKNGPRYRLRLLDLCSAADRSAKIGQCAVAVSRFGKTNLILDGLQLLPSHCDCWADAMKAVLEAVGPGNFQYGWNLSLEPRRESALSTMNGVTVASTRTLTVYAVDFNRWENWEAYFRAISENSRRSAKAANRSLPDLVLPVKTGLDALGDVAAIARLRARMGHRKGLKFTDIAVARYAFGILSSGGMVTATAVAGGKALAAFYGAEFGERTYYLEGGSAAQNQGASWSLLISMLKRAYERHPTGKFVMGYTDESKPLGPGNAGLLRSRQACRVTEYETSIVRFDYGGGGSRAGGGRPRRRLAAAICVFLGTAPHPGHVRAAPSHPSQGT